MVRNYEPALRRAVKVQFRDSRLRRQVDSMDFCQSVLANSFLRTALGQFELNSPQELLGLLATMVRNNVATQGAPGRGLPARRFRRRRRARHGEQITGPQTTPSRELAGKEMLGAVRARLRPEERELAEQRTLGGLAGVGRRTRRQRLGAAQAAGTATRPGLPELGLEAGSAG